MNMMLKFNYYNQQLEHLWFIKTFFEENELLYSLVFIQ